ncbi:gibberellin 3-beta-dioxygenase 1-like [Hibiscus syriacus]|uniref:Gibberellin 3-beta-dioxygenase 1-like n=1 Tax=Hibiscus syriacus TaxID=106335 RepID=A0A6A3ALS5_HIBSY|nr:probable 2-oxoglutarate-dependent dioxygenase AOP1.2 [Hibiscus syriacus]KAE8705076.1 gibberellin 3-beta-dioxygenase 1-like [Hibiscus syriacus]
MGMIPVIDFSKQDSIKPGIHEWDSTKLGVRQALEEYGCFEALFDPVVEHRSPVFRALEELFDLPLQTKNLCVSDKPFRGYYASPPPTSYESISADDVHIAENVEQLLTTRLWPQGNMSFSKTMVSFAQLVMELEKTIMRMISESFGVEKYVDELIDSTNYQLRAMKYEGSNTSEPTSGLVVHHDQNMLTLLYQNEVNGLEIQNKYGKWMSVKPSPNSIIVIIGESLSVWLNGRLSPPCHRVMMTENKVRYTIGVFAWTKGGYLVKAPKGLVDDKIPILFKPYDHEEFLKIFSTQLAQEVAYDVKTYCSI